MAHLPDLIHELAFFGARCDRSLWITRYLTSSDELENEMVKVSLDIHALEPWVIVLVD